RGVVTINEAEAIIEPFFDGGSSEHPTDKYSLLEEYHVQVAPGAQANVFQQWHAVIVQIDQAMSGVAAVVMERACDVRIDDYDIFRVFVSMPRWMQLTVTATVDGVERALTTGMMALSTAFA
ncbi:MAG: hypothetical protein M1546_18670, partial [Chloroflexi bacterium]|nr:hypothetical protein [Chloroflexota bacterium]